MMDWRELSVSSCRPAWAAALAAAAIGIAVSGPAAAAEPAWPTRPVTLVVPFAAGTATDVLARAVGELLGKSLKTSVIVDNKPGAGATIGASAVARAAPDGYTILVGSSTTHAANAALFRKLNYDPITDFRPVTLMGYVPQVMMVRENSPAKTVQEFIDMARSKRGQVNYGQGSSGNLLPAAILNARKDMGMAMISYKSPPQAMHDLLGGQVDMMFGDLSVSLANIKAGKLRPLAVTSSTPQPLLPQVPPLAQTLEGFELTTWIAMFAPAGTPDAIVDKLRKATHAALEDKAFAARMSEMGLRVQTSTGPELGLHVAKETIKWARYVKEAGVEAQ